MSSAHEKNGNSETGQAFRGNGVLSCHAAQAHTGFRVIGLGGAAFVLHRLCGEWKITVVQAVRHLLDDESAKSQEPSSDPHETRKNHFFEVDLEGKLFLRRGD